MKFLRYLLPIVVTACSFTLSNSLLAAEVESDRSRRDFEAVEEYLNSKRTMDLQEKSSNLTLSGDVRARWRHLTEKRLGNDILGGINIDEVTGERLSKNRFNAELNLYIDYVCDRAWGVAWLDFNNRAGIERNDFQCIVAPQACGGSGECDDVCLRKAYMGYNICCDGENRLDIELGRRPLWTVFDSRIQFQSRFDGLLLKYSTGFECWGDFYVNGGAFVIDETVNHFGYVVETGLLNIMDWGLDFKYSFINWPKGSGTNRCFVRNPLGFEFRNSQWTFAYNLNPEWLCTPASIYGAVLYNHDARSNRTGLDQRTIITDKKRGLGWYVGFIVGEVIQEGDWSLDVNYQYVEAQAINDCDLSGIGRGNFRDEAFPNAGRGEGNYKGWRFEGLYALTDNLALDAVVEFSRAAERSVGGQHSFSKFELEAIYAF